MFGRKKKTETDTVGQGRVSRQVRQGGASSPAFSYYTSRPPRGADAPKSVEREDRQSRSTANQTGKSRHLPLFLTQLPFWLLVGLAAVCALKVLWLSNDPKIIIVGKNSVAANYLQPSSVYEAASKKILSGSITNRTKLTVDAEGATKSLQQQFPELQTASLTIPLISSRPIIYVQLAQPSLLLQTAHGNFALNGSGVVLAKLQSVPSGVPLLVDQSGATPHPGKQFLPGSTVVFVQMLNYQLTKAGLATSTYVLPQNTPYELDVHLSGQNYPIRFNLQADARIQSGAAIATLQKIGVGTPTQYLDLRTPNKVYYK